jgi:hypothetical protein
MIQTCRNGALLSWSIPGCEGNADLLSTGRATPVTITVAPCGPGQSVIVQYRIDDGPIQAITAIPAAVSPGVSTRTFEAVLPPVQAGRLEFLPILLEGRRALSPSLAMPPGADSDPDRQQQRATAPSPGRPPANLQLAAANWPWSHHYLGTVMVRLREERLGETPDGLRINWHILDGHFRGPNLEAQICPGGADWMRIRTDGIGIVDVNVSFRTASQALVYANYGGMLDLGPSGYEQMRCNQYNSSAPVVVTPTYLTAAPELTWLNRLQCIGVGGVNFQSLEVCFDVYRIAVSAS